MFARKATIEYHSPARFDDMLEIGVRCTGFGRSSMRFMLEIFRGAEHLISGELVYVYADTALRKGVPVPQEWRAAIAGLEKPELQ
jgi:acyl-CoA thioester hydrolase